MLRDANGYKLNKDGFYLKESDDEEEAPEQTLSKKQRKKLRRRQQGYSDDSDSSTEEVLSVIKRQANASAAQNQNRPTQDVATKAAPQNGKSVTQRA